MVSDHFEPGELVQLSVSGLNYSDDGFAMGGTAADGAMYLFEKIKLDSYPSCNDFFGYKVAVNEGDVAVIVKYVGRPFRVKQDPAWFQYDIYEIVAQGKLCHAFRQNLGKM